MADVLGDVLGYDLEGDDVDGDDEVIVGAVAVNPRTGRRRLVKPARSAAGRGAMMQLPPKPNWRKGQIAPVVHAPSKGYIPFPLIGIPSSTFALATPNITFQGQVQEPFQPMRLLTSVVRTGASAATPRILGQLFVGTKLQQAQIAAFDIELVGTANAFDVVLTCQPVNPGVFINLQCVLSGALVGADTIFVSTMFLGKAIQ